MVSALWKAASEGDLDRVHELLREASSIDVEIKDHTGATPLIQAIRNGHVEVVKILLDRGADPNNNSAQGRPDTYTEDATILELLAAARARVEHAIAARAAVSPPPVNYMAYSDQMQYVQYPQAYYPEGMVPSPYPAYPYMYRPDMMPVPQQQPAQQQQQPPQQDQAPLQPSQSPVQRTDGGASGLPPPDVAKNIPCRYYPACRYGTSCMFAHPDTNPTPPPPPPQTYNYPVQPVTYPYSAPSYDPSAVTYPQYYQVPPSVMPGYPPMPGMPAGSYPPAVNHQRNTSDMHSPMSVPFSPQQNSAMPPMWPLGPAMSPYGQQVVNNQVSPISPADVSQGATPSPHPLLPPSPTAFYTPMQDVVVPNGPATHRRSFSTSRSVQYFPTTGDDMADGVPQPEPQTVSYSRGSGRGRGRGRGQYVGGRQPPSNVPCLFFPTGKCKNGDSCRFAHIMPGPDDPIPVPNPRPYRARSSVPPPPNETIGQPTFPTIQEPHSGPLLNGHGRNGGPNGSSPTSGGTGFDRLRAERNGNGKQTAGSSRASSVASRQRVPNADDFPALGGGPAANNALKPISGPTAAQVLQAPAPRSTSKARSHSGSSSEKITKPSNDEVLDLANKLEAVTVVDAVSDMPRAPTPALESEPLFA